MAAHQRAAIWNRDLAGSDALREDPATTSLRCGMQVGSYCMHRTLGMGTFGKVKVADHLATGLQVAIKMVNRAKVARERMEEKVRREIDILRLCRHAHIIRLYEVIDTPSDTFMVLEYASNGDLFDYIMKQGRLEEEEARHWFGQLVAGVQYIHCAGIVHRDLKPENLLLDGAWRIKLADFGLANVLRDGELLRTSCGSPNYAAPEVIAGRLYAGPEVDAWSIGVILYAFLCGRLPFEDESMRSLFKRIRNGIYSIPNHVTPVARDLVSRMLVVDPIARLTLGEIRNHPWFLDRPASFQHLPNAALAERLDDDAIDAVVDLVERGAIPDCRADKAAMRDRIVLAVLGDDRIATKKWTRDIQVSYQLVSDQKRMARCRNGQPGDAVHQASDSVSHSGTSQTHSISFCKQIALSPAQPSPLALNANHSHFHHVRRRPGNSSSRIQRKRWYLGIQSRKDPPVVMGEVYTALRRLDCDWQKPSRADPYRVRARQHAAHAQPVTIALNLFKVQVGVFLLDFQNVDGNWFTFMSLAGDIIRTLQGLSAEAKRRTPKQHDQP